MDPILQLFMDRIDTPIGLAVARQQLGSLDKVTRIVRLGACNLLQDVFSKDKNPSRLIIGAASLPIGVPVELELIFEVTNSRKRS